jgi:hypothetical protein
VAALGGPFRVWEQAMTAHTILPRGIRNNNPLNIRLDPENRWQGKVPPKHNSDGPSSSSKIRSWGCGRRRCC